MPDPIVPFDKTTGDSVLIAELVELRERRKQVFHGQADLAAPTDGQTGIDQAHRFRPFGLALSGGGIRSATFNLGILQGLASRGLLPYVDYLSTVSGGGYIGTWLHGVIRRRHDGDPWAAGDRLNPVENPEPGPAENDPITFLRKYSSYLAPRGGLFSADFWVIGSIWIRNMMLNQLILLPFLAAVMALALITGCWVREAPTLCAGYSIAILVFLLLGMAVWNAGKSLGAISASEFDKEQARDPRRSWAWPTTTGVLLAALFFFWLHWSPSGGAPIGSYLYLVAVAMFVLMFVLQFLGGFRSYFERTHRRKGWVWLHLFWMPAVAGAATSAILFGLMYAIASSGNAWHAVIWGPPSLVAALITGVALLIGLMGADFPDASREWLARIGAVLGINCFAWIAIVGLAVYAPKGLAWLGWKYGGAAIALWMASTAAGVQAGKSPKTNGGAEGTAMSKAREWVLKFAPAVFMLGILILISAACHVAIAFLGGGYQGATPPPAVNADLPNRTRVEIAMPGPNAAGATVKVDAPACCIQQDKKSTFDAWFAWLAPFVNNYDNVLARDTCKYAGWILLVCGGLAAFLPLRFNINEFSMHHFYKNRLVRCYLGASNKNRKPNRFTGFDPKDDLTLADLVPSATKDNEKPYLGPYPIMNTALNLNAGSELATQERKAASFVFTPRYCGFDPPHGKETGPPKSRLADDAYRETRGFCFPNGPRIGTAMAISGAAANPNWGYHTSAPVAFLLTLFNVRLGWWVGNPRIKCTWKAQCPSERPGPLYGLLWLIWELLGQTTGGSAYVNLSDGGHFENLGLYELVRRRCRYIIVGDGEQDDKYTFESLGGAIRKCRADFGVEIDINIEQIRNKDESKRTHCVVGTITYPEDLPQGDQRESIAQGQAPPEDNHVRGWILYFKASLTGDEPEDVKQYHDSHPDFPHQTTLNQFFTESQFESYRRLGLHVVESAFENAGTFPNPEEPHPLRKLFQRMAALWYGPSNLAAGVATKHAEAYSALMKQLSDDTDFRFLDNRLILRDPRGPDFPVPTDDTKTYRKAYFLILDLIQLMENVWSDFGLDVAANRNNPRNQGWMNVFRHWAEDDFFYGIWQQVRKNYNPLFGDFVRDLVPGR